MKNNLTIRIGSKEYNSHFGVFTKEKLALVVTLILHKFDKCKFKLVDTNNKRLKYDIDIDQDVNILLPSIDKFLNVENYFNTKPIKNMFKLQFGTVLRAPTGLNWSLASTITTAMSLLSFNDIVKILVANNKRIHPLRWYMDLIIASKTRTMKKDKIVAELEDNGEIIGYFKAICSKYKIPFEFNRYVHIMHHIYILFEILENPTKEEYDRNTVITLANTLTIYHFSRKSNPTYYVVKDVIEHRLLYSIYYHTYTDDNGETKNIILVNVICKNTKENKKRIKEIGDLAQSRYPDMKVNVGIHFIRR